MLAIVSKLITGTGVDETSHPSLVGLLELAARGSGIPSGSPADTPAMRKRLLRDWKRVCEAFRDCVAVSVSDADLLGAAADSVHGFTFHRLGLLHPMSIKHPDVWSYSAAAPPHGARAAVAKALELVSGLKAKALQPFDIKSVADLRRAQKANRLPALDAPLLDAPGKVEGGLMPGCRFIVSWLIFGRRLWVAFQSDEFGRVEALGYRDCKRWAVEVAESMVPPVS